MLIFNKEYNIRDNHIFNKKYNVRLTWLEHGKTHTPEEAPRAGGRAGGGDVHGGSEGETEGVGGGGRERGGRRQVIQGGVDILQSPRTEVGRGGGEAGGGGKTWRGQFVGQGQS